MKTKKFWPLVLCLGFLAFTGCGYTLNHRLKEQFSGFKGIFVPVFANHTQEPGAEIVFTNALIHEMESHGEKILGERDSEGLELNGSIDTIDYRAHSQTPVGFQGLHPHVRIPDNVAVNVQMTLSLVETKTKRLVWRQTFPVATNVLLSAGATTLYRTYDVDAPSSFGLSTQSLIELSYVELARKVSRDVYDGMVEFF